MGAPVKFLFEDDFAGGGAPAKPVVPLAQHEAQLAQVQTEAYRNGLNAAEAQIAGRTAAACDRIAQGIMALTQSLRAIEARLEAESVEVAVAVARKLAPETIAAEPFAEIAALAAGCFRQLVAAPHVVVRIAEPIYEQAHTRLEEIPAPAPAGLRRPPCRWGRARHGARRLPHRMGRRRGRARPRQDRGRDLRSGRALCRRPPRQAPMKIPNEFS